MKPYARRSQRGIALVTAMLVVAMAVTIAASLSLGQQIWIRQAQNLLDRSQAESMRHATLEYVGVMLVRDAKNNKVDTLADEWAKQFTPLPFEGGVIAIAIEDAQGRFNINTLHGPPEQGAQINQQAAVFRKILELNGLDPILTEAVIDWLDADSDTRGGGAEDTEYLNTGQPYRAANQALVSIEELRLIQGFDAAAVEKLRPYVIALPTPQSTLNINTVPDVVLASMFNNMTLDQARLFIQVRNRRPFDGKDSQQVTKLLPDGVTQAVGWAYTSSYFLVKLNVTYGRWTRSTTGLVQRENNSAKVLWHHSQYPALPTEEDAAEIDKDNDENDS